MKITENFVEKIGWTASITAIIMFSSYIDQIRLNIRGDKGSVFLPLATLLNCICWLLYAVLKKQKDYPLIVCNIIGIILASLTAVTAIL